MALEIADFLRKERGRKGSAKYDAHMNMLNDDVLNFVMAHRQGEANGIPGHPLSP